MLKILIPLLLFIFNIQPGQQLQEFITHEVSGSNEEEGRPPAEFFIDNNSTDQQSYPEDEITNNAQFSPPLPTSGQAEHPDTGKISAYNNSSGKIIENVTQIAVDKSSALEDCGSSQDLCTPTPTPTLIPTPTIIPDAIPTLIPFTDLKPPKPMPTVIHPPCNFEPHPGYNLSTPDVVDCM